MKRGRILNAELNKAIAMMGHGDIFMVCDAGFPVPLERWRIDLAITQNVPDLFLVLELILGELSVERVYYADMAEQYNAPMVRRLEETFAGTGAEFEVLPNERILHDIAGRAKVIVRTGAYNPFGNIGMVCGTDPDEWFALPGTIMPEAYRERRTRMGR